MHWIVESRISAHSALKAAETVNFPEQLNLKPSVPYLDCGTWFEDPG